MTEKFQENCLDCSPVQRREKKSVLSCVVFLCETIHWKVAVVSAIGISISRLEIALEGDPFWN